MRQDQIGKMGDETGSDRKEGWWDMRLCRSVTELLQWWPWLKCHIALLSVTWFTEVLRCSAECYKVHWSVASLCWGLHGLPKCYIALLSVTWFTEVLHHSAECYMVHWSVTSLCWVLHGSLKCYIALLNVTWFTEVFHHSAECYMVHWSVTLLCWVLHGSLKCYIALQSVTWFIEARQDSSEVVRDFTEVWQHYWSVAGLQWSGMWYHWSVITLLKWCRTPVVLCDFTEMLGKCFL